MIAVLQRCASSKVEIEGNLHSHTGYGLLILLGVTQNDTEEKARWLAEKTVNLRIFSDEEGKMNRSLLDISGSVMCISNFTLCADCRKGRRPSFAEAMAPQRADELYNLYCDSLKKAGAASVKKGSFGADMLVTLQNDGPVTIILDTDKIMPNNTGNN